MSCSSSNMRAAAQVIVSARNRLRISAAVAHPSIRAPCEGASLAKAGVVGSADRNGVCCIGNDGE